MNIEKAKYYQNPEVAKPIIKNATKYLNAKEVRRIAAQRVVGLIEEVSKAAGINKYELKPIDYMNTGHYTLFQNLTSEIHKANKTMKKLANDYDTAEYYNLI
jgi:regulator of PEP synthase PpsR (kinase-PPPase family)